MLSLSIKWNSIRLCGPQPLKVLEKCTQNSAVGVGVVVVGVGWSIKIRFGWYSVSNTYCINYNVLLRSQKQHLGMPIAPTRLADLFALDFTRL